MTLPKDRPTPPRRRATFLLRLWTETAAEETRWRCRLEALPGNEGWSFPSVAELVRFLEAYVQENEVG